MMRMMPPRILLLLALAGCATHSVESAFVPVFIDARTETKLGPFPYDRAVSAKALIAFQQLGAKGVVMKFFFDQPKSAGDDTLANAMTKLPVILQARCDDSEAKQNPLDARFSTAAPAQMNFAVSCKAGWIPLPQFQKNAAAVCFVDQPAVDEPPLRERYQGRAVKTLYTCALEMAQIPLPATNASGTLKIDLTQARRVPVISLIDVLEGKIDREQIAGKIVVFGYEGPKATMYDSAIGRISAHHGFMANLLVLEQLGK